MCGNRGPAEALAAPSLGLAKEGAAVIINYNGSEDKARALAEEILKAGEKRRRCAMTYRTRQCKAFSMISLAGTKDWMFL